MLNQLDETDIRILQLLQENARLTGQEIGLKLNKTTTPINNRIRSLQERGYIKKYVAVLDHEKLELDFMTFTNVQLKDHSHHSLSHFENEIIKFPEVLECYHLTGDFDFILKITVKDRKEYHDFLMNKLFAIIAIGKVETKLVMKAAKTETALPIGKPH
jgi:Lrp/AsnC family leucine-responsive transcriptional regulator